MAIELDFLLYFLNICCPNLTRTRSCINTGQVVAPVDGEKNDVKNPVVSEDDMEETIATLEETAVSPLTSHPRGSAEPSCTVATQGSYITPTASAAACQTALLSYKPIYAGLPEVDNRVD